MRYSLRNQLLLPLLAVALASLLAVGLLSAWWVTTATRERIETQLAGVVRVLADPRFPLTRPVLEQMRDLSKSEFVVVGESGEQLATSGPSLDATTPSRELPRDGSQIALGPRIETGGRGYYHSSLRLATATGKTRPAVLHVLYPTDEYDSAWRAAFVPPLLVGLLSITGVSLVATIVASRVAGVGRRLGREVRRLATGDFSPVALPNRDDELRDLAEAIDQTAMQLASYEQQVRETEKLRTANLLGASLAHEMRNVATGCRMALDLHGNTCSQPGDDTLDVARRQLSLMETRLRRFLQLAKPGESLPRVAVDIGQVVDEIVNLARPIAKHARTSFEWQRPIDSMVVAIDREEFVQSVLNLLLNAIDAVRPVEGGAIAVELAARGLQAELIVSDNGPGPSESVAARMFEPFVTDKPEGAGLGLAGAMRFAGQHAGGLQWKRTNGRTQFVMTLPLEKET